jgi:hypothetical protein
MSIQYQQIVTIEAHDAADSQQRIVYVSWLACNFFGWGIWVVVGIDITVVYCLPCTSPFLDSRHNIVHNPLVSVTQLALQDGRPWRVFRSSTILIVNEVI